MPQPDDETDDIEKSMKWYRTGNLSAHLVCFLMYSELDVRHLGVCCARYLTVILRRVSGITVLLYTQALDKKQHNHELKGVYLKLIVHSRHVFLQYA